MEDEAHLAKLFVRTQKVRIETRDGVWREVFYLPTMESQNGAVLKVVLDVKSTWATSVHFNGKLQVRLNANTTTLFENISGTWTQQGLGRIREYLIIYAYVC